MIQKLYKTRLIVMLLVAGFLPGATHADLINQKAPNFSIENLLDGQQISLKQFHGKVVYLDFWASWCPPCIKSFPFMEELNRKYNKRGLVVIAIGLDEKREDAMAFLNKAEAPTFVIGHNIRGDIATSYNVEAMPSTYLIGRDGKIKLRHLGFKSSDMGKLQKVIESAL